MAKDKTKSEPKIVLEREYIVPLREEWLKVPKYKRANKAVKALKQFMVRHMKIYDRDLRKVKIDNILNNEIRFRGMKKPPAKIQVKAKKYDDGSVRVELVNIPEHIKFARLREEKIKSKVEKKIDKKDEQLLEKVGKTGEKGEKEDEGKKAEAKEKEEASKEESLKLAEKQAKEQKHVSKDSKMMMPRKTLSR